MVNKVSLPKTMKWPIKLAYLKLWKGQNKVSLPKAMKWPKKLPILKLWNGQ